MMEIMIRKGKADDAADLADVETACFPPAEAATAEEIAARLSRLSFPFLPSLCGRNFDRLH